MTIRRILETIVGWFGFSLLSEQEERDHNRQKEMLAVMDERVYQVREMLETRFHAFQPGRHVVYTREYTLYLLLWTIHARLVQSNVAAYPHVILHFFENGAVDVVEENDLDTDAVVEHIRARLALFGLDPKHVLLEYSRPYTLFLEVYETPRGESVREFAGYLRAAAQAGYCTLAVYVAPKADIGDLLEAVADAPGLSTL